MRLIDSEVRCNRHRDMRALIYLIQVPELLEEKTSKLITVIISFYLTSVHCQSISSTIFLQSLLQLSIVLVSLSVQFVAKLEFNSLILSICCSQFRESVTIVEVFLYETVESFYHD